MVAVPSHAGWIEDTNGFKLERPPDWFLTGLVGYDEQLVIIPSRRRKQYLLCRRRKYSVGLGDVAMLDNKHPDTNMCYGYGVLPIAPLRWEKSNSDAGMFTQSNLASLIETLKERDSWALGGGPLALDPDAAVKAWDAAEAAREKKEDKALWERFYHMGRDGWRSLQARRGARNKRASDYHGVARTKPQKGGGVILTDAR
jgi:hypothetical protein